MRLCSLDGCQRRHMARGLCTKHYDAQRRAATAHPRLPLFVADDLVAERLIGGLRSGKPIGAVAAECGVSERTIFRWRRMLESAA